jgi:hypothetical protein
MSWKETIKANKWWVIIGFLAILGVIIFFASSCGGNGGSGGGGTSASVPPAVKRVWEASSKSVPAADDVQQRTGQGVTIYSRAGLTPQHLTDADAALDELFKDVEAAYPGQTLPIALGFGNYDIYEPDHDCILSPESRTPSFYVRDGRLQYDGGIYDQYNSRGPGVKDGASVVLAPERVWGMTTTGSTTEGSPTPRAKFLICPDLSVWRNGVRFGAEHNVGETACSRQIDGSPANVLCQLAYANQTHTTGGHPFIPSRAAGLKALTRTPWGSEFAPLPQE